MARGGAGRRSRGLRDLLVGGEAVDPRRMRRGPGGRRARSGCSTATARPRARPSPSGAWSTRSGRGGDGADRPAARQHRGSTCSTPACGRSPVGVPGELYLGGDGLARGYLAAAGPDRRALRARSRSARPGARLYRTGDLARWLPDGAPRVPRPHRPQVKVRGFRIEPGEIEAALRRPSGRARRRWSWRARTRPATGVWSAYVVGARPRPARSCARVPGASGCRTTWCRRPSCLLEPCR